MGKIGPRVDHLIRVSRSGLVFSSQGVRVSGSQGLQEKNEDTSRIFREMKFDRSSGDK